MRKDYSPVMMEEQCGIVLAKGRLGLLMPGLQQLQNSSTLSPSFSWCADEKDSMIGNKKPSNVVSIGVSWTSRFTLDALIDQPYFSSRMGCFTNYTSNCLSMPVSSKLLYMMKDFSTQTQPHNIVRLPMQLLNGLDVADYFQDR